MPVIVGNVKVYLGPETQGGPDSLEAPIIEFIDSAKSRQNLMIAVQEVFESDEADKQKNQRWYQKIY